ncbi:alpha/beta fold hydrolase [Clostridium sp. DJ247]|uniref:alpha/beta fold hydrolase n=1 Tax=Clostridium sp. DJ247 TaxID=2726188 RepID=UPI00162AE2E5|nr:alpha/beta hydrolase [Clostridium sp. DJ247]MBC2582438.1 alpha/beta hydrolase [Clostridium sp. DJ247]
MKVALVFRKLYKKRLSKFLIIFFAILAIGTIWQNIMLYYEGKELNYPGQLIDVNNHKMHIFGKGNGSPTIVLTVGSGTPCAYTDFYFIQQEISKSTRTVTYDRPGYGWSKSTSIPRTVDEQVNDLHEILDKAGEKPPYILVGHSLSSLEVIRYAQLFPKEVSGIVLIDGGNPEYYADYYAPGAVLLNYFLEGLRDCGVVRALGSIGILTPMVNEDKRYKLLPKELSKIDKMMFYKNLGNKTNRSEIRNMNENAKKIIDNGKLGDIPLVILTSKGDSYWEKTQRELKNWSNNSMQEDIIGANHYIHWDKPNIVIEKIQGLVKELRINVH